METDTTNTRQGWFLAFFGIAGFSLTLPATRIAVPHLDPWFVALGRGVLAAALAAIALGVTRQPWPKTHHLRGLTTVGLGVIVGFPVLSAWAMQELPASHGGITLSITPMVTALLGAWLTGERLPARFWLASLVGAMAVFAFALHTGDGALRLGDLWLLAAALLAAIGYAEGACSLLLGEPLSGSMLLVAAIVVSSLWISQRAPARLAEAGNGCGRTR